MSEAIFLSYGAAKKEFYLILHPNKLPVTEMCNSNHCDKNAYLSTNSCRRPLRAAPRA